MTRYRSVSAVQSFGVEPVFWRSAGFLTLALTPILTVHRRAGFGRYSECSVSEPGIASYSGRGRGAVRVSAMAGPHVVSGEACANAEKDHIGGNRHPDTPGG